MIRTCACAYQGGKKCSFFYRKIWRALFSCNTRFEICPFALRTTTLFEFLDPGENSCKIKYHDNAKEMAEKLVAVVKHLP